MADEPRKSLFEQQRDFVRQQAEVSPFAANWPARTWIPGERVTSGMMNGVRDQLNELHTTIGGISPANVAFLNQANVFTQNQTVTVNGGPPKLILAFAGSTAKSRVLVATSQDIWIMRNIDYTGQWLKDDISMTASFLGLDSAGNLQYYTAPAGPNPATFTNRFSVGFDGTTSINGRLNLTGLNPALTFGGTTAGFPALRCTPGDGSHLEVVSADTPSSVYMPLRAHHYIAQNAGNNFPDLTVTGATSFQTLSAARIVTSAAGSNLADLTCGPTNFTAGVRCTAGGISTDRVTNNDITSGWNMFSTAPMYPGRLDTGWTTQTSWYLASHGAYGLYTNTGMYYEGGVNFPSFTSRGAGNIAGGLTISSGGIDATGYSYIRTPGGSGDASLFLMNPAAGGATQNFRLMSYAGVFRIWNGDNSVELFTLGGAGNAGFAGSLTLGASGSLREYGRSIPNGVAQIVQAADYVHGQMYNVTGQVTVSTIGKTINMTFCINGNFTSGASVNMTIPFGFLPASSLHIPVSVNHGWEAWHHGICAISNGQYYVTFYDVHLNAMPDNGALWLYGSVTFPIQ